MEEEENVNVEEEESFRKKVKNIAEKAKEKYKNRYGIPDNYREKTEEMKADVEEEKAKEDYIRTRKTLANERYKHSMIGRATSAVSKFAQPKKTSQALIGSYRENFSINPAIYGVSRKKPRRPKYRMNPKLRKLMGV